MKRTLFIGIFTLFCLVAHGQTPSDFVQTFFLPGQINPAAVGEKSGLLIASHNRFHFLGSSQNFIWPTFSNVLGHYSYHLRAEQGLERSGIGLGGYFQYEKTLFPYPGSWNAGLQMSYQIKAVKRGQLRLGVNGGWYSEIGKADFGLGVWYRHPKWFAGFSTTRYGSSFTIHSPVTYSVLREMDYDLMTGVNFDAGNGWQVQPRAQLNFREVAGRTQGAMKVMLIADWREKWYGGIGSYSIPIGYYEQWNLFTLTFGGNLFEQLEFAATWDIPQSFANWKSEQGLELLLKWRFRGRGD